MRLTIDTDALTMVLDENGKRETIELYSKRAFEIISHWWLKVGWNEKYTYAFTWLGRPIIQLPEDMFRLQEVIYRVKPDVIIETGIAHGGSLVFVAAICRSIRRGRVIGVDIELRPHNREALECHELADLITLVEGDSVEPAVVRRVKSSLNKGETALVLLDSKHTKEHVMRELEAYHDLISPGSYLLVADGIMQDFSDVPRGRSQWLWDNPAAAVRDFLAGHPEFVLEIPPRIFNESQLTENVTYWPGAWLRRV
ncbi:MAG: cephalosporin hydroxylase family protein [Thermodesulfobacteriota bacterium]